MTLDDIGVGETVIIKKFMMAESLRRRMMDIGFTPNTRVTVLHKGYGGYPVACLVRGCVVALREEELRGILIGDG